MEDGSYKKILEGWGAADGAITKSEVNPAVGVLSLPTTDHTTGAAMDSQQDHAAPVLNKAVPVRHPGRWISAVIILGVLAVFLQSLVTNPNFRWDIVGTYILDVKVVQGVGWTLLLTVASMVLAIVLAILLAFMRQSENPVFRWSSWVWVWFFRGTPVYTQLVFWGLVSVLYPKIAPASRSDRSCSAWTPARSSHATVAAILGLGLNESAYLAEIFRAGLKSVDHGQMEAAEALGMAQDQDHVADHPAAGHARDRAADRQRNHRHAEDHLAGPGGAVHPGPDLRHQHAGQPDLPARCRC